MDGARVCYTCKVEKPLTEFGNRKDKPLGKAYLCKKCNNQNLVEWRKNNPERAAAAQAKNTAKWQKKNPEKSKEHTYRWRAKHPRRYRDLRIKGRYGLEVGEYEKMLADQGGGCAICKSAKPGARKSFHVDHCHETNIVRGLLCISCNTSLGKFKHDPVILQAAIDYLKR